MAFNEKLAKKLKKILAKAGLEEDKIEEVVEEVAEATAEETNEEEGNPEELPVPPSEEEGANPEEVVEEVVEEGEPTPNQDPEGEVPPQEEVPPTDGNIEAALNELAAQEGEVPPQEEVVAPTPEQPVIPQIDPSEVEQLRNDLGEANKTIEGLVARIDSLEEALKTAGVITGESKLGDETPRITPSANQESVDAFDDIIDHINGK